MKYADKVIELMAAHPGRDFRMRQIIRYINPRAGCVERVAIKKAVQRVIVALVSTGNVMIGSAKTNGGAALYTWKPGH